MGYIQEMVQGTRPFGVETFSGKDSGFSAIFKEAKTVQSFSLPYQRFHPVQYLGILCDLSGLKDPSLLLEALHGICPEFYAS